MRRLSFFTLRGKQAVEDFAQLAGKKRSTKYDLSMERVAEIVERYTTFPAVEKIELFRRVVVCFLTGNEDMHLKNFSLLVDGDRVRLSPAVIEDVLSRIEHALPGWEELIAASFLTEGLRDGYRSVIEERRRRLGL